MHLIDKEHLCFSNYTPILYCTFMSDFNNVQSRFYMIEDTYQKFIQSAISCFNLYDGGYRILPIDLNVLQSFATWFQLVITPDVPTQLAQTT